MDYRRRSPAGRSFVAALAMATVGWGCRDAGGYREIDKLQDAKAVVASAGHRPVTDPYFSSLKGKPTLSGEGATRLELRAAAAMLEGHALSDATEENVRWAALARVALGDADGCVKTFEVIDERSLSPDGWSDIAACHLTLASDTGSVLSVATALDAALAGVAIAPSHEAARHNLRLARERLGLHVAGEPTLGEPSTIGFGESPALSGGRESGSAEILGICSAQAAEAPTNRHADFEREALFRCVLPSWASAVAGGRQAEIIEAGARAAELATSVALATGDRCFVTLVNEFVHDCGNGCTALANGWSAVSELAQAWDAGRQDLATAWAPKVAEGFPELKSLAAAYAWIELASVERLQQRPERAEERLLVVSEYAQNQGCRHLVGRALWPLALLRFERSEPQAALDAALVALPLLRDAHDREAYAVLSNVTAWTYQELDALEDGWRHAREALDGLQYSRHLRRQSILTGVANLARSCRLHRTAAHLRGISVRDATSASNWTTLAFLLPRYAGDLDAIGNTTEALWARRLAETAVARVADPDTRELAFVSLAQAYGESRDPIGQAQATATLQTALAIVRRRNMSFQLPRLLGLLARSAATGGQIEVASEAVREARVHITRQLAGARTPSSRRLLRQQLWQVTVAAAEGRWHAGQHTAAFDLIEQSARFSAADVTQRFLVLRYVVTSDRILVVGGTNRAPVRFAVSRPAQEVLADVTRVRRLLEQERVVPETDVLLKRLFDDLLSPVRAHVAEVTNLVVYPDGDLYDLPFSALVDRDSGQYLIERVALQYGGEQQGNPGNLERRALLVAPTSRQEFADLSHARDEVGALAQVYRQAVLLRGDIDTAEVLMRLNGSNVLHFSGHATINRTRPEESELVLGKGRMLAEDLDGLTFRGLQLVVLGACRTASGLPAGEGVRSGLVSAFLQTGAEAVVATQWAVEDRDAKDVVVLMHRHWAGGRSAAESLRHAQRHALARARDRPWAWSAFMVFGQSGNRGGEVNG